MKRHDGRRDIAAAYSEWADVYETSPNRTRERAAEVLRAHGPEFADRDVVEVGCGTGFNTAWIAERARSVVAMDFSEGMLARAEERVRSEHVRFVRHDIRERWPVEDASADLVVAMLVLEHVETLSHFFSEAARVLRPGGEVFVCELHPYRQLEGRQAEFVSPETGERVPVTAYVHDVSEYVNEAVEAGLAIASVGEWRDDGVALPRALTLRAHRNR